MTLNCSSCLQCCRPVPPCPGSRDQSQGFVHARQITLLAELRPSPSFLFQRTRNGGSFGCFLCLNCYLPLPPQMLSSAPGMNSAKLASTTPSRWPYSHIPGQEKAEAWVLSLTLAPGPDTKAWAARLPGEQRAYVSSCWSWTFPFSNHTLWSEEGWVGMGWETASMEGALPPPSPTHSSGVPHWRRERSANLRHPPVPALGGVSGLSQRARNFCSPPPTP